MDALFRVGEVLEWGPTTAPRGSLLLLRDCVDASGAFLVHHFLSLFAKAGHRVVLVNTAHSKEHYAAVARKLVASFAGVNFRALEDQGRLQVIDLFEDADRLEELSPGQLFDEIQAAVGDGSVPVSIVIDDCSAIKWSYGAHKLVRFVRCLKALTLDENESTNVVVLNHVDTEQLEGDSSSYSADAVLLDLATVSFLVSPLPSGYSRDVHGTLLVVQHCSGSDHKLALPEEISFKMHLAFTFELWQREIQAKMGDRMVPIKSRDGLVTIERIGRGAFGDVYLCDRQANGDRVCIKEVDLQLLSPAEKSSCLEEVAVLRRLPRHPHVVALLDAFYDAESPNLLLLILEFADGGDLSQFISDSYEAMGMSSQARVQYHHTALMLFAQVVEGIAFLHEQHVLHRDLKPQNVLLIRDGGIHGLRAVVGDFGSSKTLASRSALAETIVGSPLYMSPELLESEPHGTATDIWSLGCILYELFAGHPPFKASSYPAVVRKITNGDFALLTSAQSSDDVRELVSWMVRRDPNQRPSAFDILNSSGLACYTSTKEITHATIATEEKIVFPENHERCNGTEPSEDAQKTPYCPIVFPPPVPIASEPPVQLSATNVEENDLVHGSNEVMNMSPAGIELPRNLKVQPQRRTNPKQMVNMKYNTSRKDTHKPTEKLSLPLPPPAATRALHPCFVPKSSHISTRQSQPRTKPVSTAPTNNLRNTNASIHPTNSSSRETTTAEQLLVVGVGISSRCPPTSQIIKNKRSK